MTSSLPPTEPVLDRPMSRRPTWGNPRRDQSPRRSSLSFSLVLTLLCCTWAAAADGPPRTLAQCKERLPTSLQAVLAQKYPRRVLELKQWRYHGIPEEQRCGVAVADFDGNGERDIAVMLRRAAPESLIIVVALATGEGWTTRQISRCDGIECQGSFVAVAEPRTYTSLDGRIYRVRNPAVLGGGWESSSFVLFWRKGEWIEVWTSD